ncbi:hypothetical protein SUGI_0020590 [Cryptomeria japonica]|nr:hypothetical protein SUGI_0020590 [Cryptomeria japonica]
MFKHPEKLWCRIMRHKYLEVDNPERILTIANSPRGSFIWKFLWESRGVITNHLTRKVGNGRRAGFWRDLWSGGMALEDLLADKDKAMALEDRADRVEANYFHNNAQTGDLAVWRLDDGGILREDERERIFSELRGRKVVVVGIEDEVIWCVAASRKYSVKLGYDILKKRSEGVGQLICVGAIK